MSKKHRHRHICEEELELCPRNNMFQENSPQRAGDSSVMLIGLLEMLGSQFNIFGNNEENNHEDLSSKVQAEDENNVLNPTLDDIIENNNDNIIEHVEYEVKENTIEDIEESNAGNIFDTEDKCDSDVISFIGNVEETSNINDIEFTENYITVNCKAKVSNNKVLECCFSKNIKSKFIKESVVSKLPVVISEIEIPIYIETLVKFNEPAFKILDVNKDVFLQSCHLINNSNKLFIKGFIRENITYSNIDCVTNHAVSGNVKNLEIDIPFKCSTKVYFNSSPVLNSEVCCKMDSTKILETMSQEECIDLKKTLPETYTFKVVRKKIVLNLRLSLVQEQYVFISK